MRRIFKLLKAILRLVLPLAAVLLIAFFGAAYFFIDNVTKPRATRYLVTPETYGPISTRGSKVTDETWTNSAGVKSRGWLLRGNQGLPGIVLLHRYGADRSHTLDLGVKINESTNFTILMPDLRAHGENPLVERTSFGSCETDDAIATVGFLKSLHADDGRPLVGKNIGVFGVELGAYAALAASEKDEGIRALVLDSIPMDSDQLLGSAVSRQFPVGRWFTARIAQAGAHLYFMNSCYTRRSLCDVAKNLSRRKVLLLGGPDAPDFQASTSQLALCFNDQTSVEQNVNLLPSGFNDTSASIEQAQIYDERVIDFFRRTLLP